MTPGAPPTTGHRHDHGEAAGAAAARPGCPPPDRGRWLRWLGLALPLALLGVHLATGFYVVDTDEQGVVRRFGALAERVGPGMHYRLPWPVDRVDVLKTTSVMKAGSPCRRTAGAAARWSAWSC